MRDSAVTSDWCPVTGENLSQLEFSLLRMSRDVIKEAPIRMNHLLQMPRGERTCPLQEVLYRRAGLRIVGKHGMSEREE